MNDRNITKTSIINPNHYFSKVLFQEQIEKIFSNSWQWIGHRNILNENISAKPFSLLPGCLDEPLLLTRDKKGSISCLSNVCTHRGACLVEKGSNLDSIRCPFHGRRFTLSGLAESAPGFEGDGNFPTEEDNLTRLELESFGGHYFTQVGNAPFWFGWLGPLKSIFDSSLLSKFEFDPLRSKEIEVPASWILYCENYLDGFQVSIKEGKASGQETHTTFDMWEHGVLQKNKSNDGQDSIQYINPETGLNNKYSALNFWLFPNLMLNFYPWGLSICIVIPQSPENCIVKVLSYIFSPELLTSAPGSALFHDGVENKHILKSLQRGVKSRLYMGGRNNAAYERGVHHFHNIFLNKLNEK